MPGPEIGSFRVVEISDHIFGLERWVPTGLAFAPSWVRLSRFDSLEAAEVHMQTIVRTEDEQIMRARETRKHYYSPDGRPLMAAAE